MCWFDYSPSIGEEWRNRAGAKIAPISIFIFYLATSIFTFLFLIGSFLINCKVWLTLVFRTATKEKKSFTSISPISSFFNFPFLVRNPTISTLFTLSFLPAAINNVLHTGFGGNV